MPSRYGGAESHRTEGEPMHATPEATEATDPLEMGRIWAEQRAAAGDHVGAATMRRAIAALETWLSRKAAR